MPYIPNNRLTVHTHKHSPLHYTHITYRAYVRLQNSDKVRSSLRVWYILLIQQRGWFGCFFPDVRWTFAWGYIDSTYRNKFSFMNNLCDNWWGCIRKHAIPLVFRNENMCVILFAYRFLWKAHRYLRFHIEQSKCANSFTFYFPFFYYFSKSCCRSQQLPSSSVFYSAHLYCASFLWQFG